MKLLFFLALINLQAWGYGCPKTYWTQEKAQIAHARLNQFAGQHDINNCFVEITTCDPEEDINEGAPIGEVVIATPDGRSEYVSIDFPHKRDRRFRTRVKSYKRAFVYRKKDRYFEPINGRTEVWQLEFHTEWEDLNTLKGIELGRYTTNSQLNQSNGNDSHWYVCHPE